MLGMLHRLIEDPARRDRFIKFAIPFSFVCGTLAPICLALARHYG